MTTRGWTLFAAVSVIWGLPYLFIKVAVDHGLTPGFVAWSRVVIATMVLLPIAIRRGALRGLPLAWLVAFATAEMVIPFPLIGWGEQRIASSLTAILISALPLIVALLALRFDHSERPTRTRLLGMFVGLAGVAALVGIDLGGSSRELAGAAAVLLATVGYAIGPMIVKRRLADSDPVGPVTAAMAIAAVLLLPFGIAGFPSSAPAGDAILSVVVLGLVCSAVAFMLFFQLIAEVGPGRAAVITYINPIVALALGVAILGEKVGAGSVAGLLLILAGSWLATGGRMPPRLRAGRSPIAPAVPPAD